MTDPRAQRTLVKSPPELWAEVSDHDALTRHLNEFGSIRITRTDPETTVAWEGDRVRGTVELEATGWGTKVTLTAEATAPEPVAEPTVEEEAALPVAAPARAAAPLPEAEVEAPAAPRRSFLSFWRRGRRAAAPPIGSEPSAPSEPSAVLPAPPSSDPVPDPPLAAAAPDPLKVEAVLVGVLDELGSATKRPFSR